MPNYQHQVTPFGNLRIKAYLPLPEAYRSLSRPSSPVSTKASTVCPSKLDSYLKSATRTSARSLAAPGFFHALRGLATAPTAGIATGFAVKFDVFGN